MTAAVMHGLGLQLMIIFIVNWSVDNFSWLLDPFFFFYYMSENGDKNPKWCPQMYWFFSQPKDFQFTVSDK